MSERQLERAVRLGAELIINLHGGTEPLPEHYATGRLVYLETDPVELQIELHDERAGDDRLPRAALRLLHLRRELRAARLRPAGAATASSSTRPASRWSSTSGPDRGGARPATSSRRSATGGSRGGTSPSTASATRWSKHHEFLKFLDLPARTGAAVRACADAATSPQDRELLDEQRLAGARTRSTSRRELDAYRDYIGGSRGEFTVAKDQNVRLRTGWFSDRSATYLAAGRPVITQDTGFGNVLPDRRGAVRRSRSMDERRPGGRGDRGRLRDASAGRVRARARVLRLRGRARSDARGGRCRRVTRAGGQRPDAFFRRTWSSTPVSRRPTSCLAATVEAALRASGPDTEDRSTARPRQRQRSSSSRHDGLPFTRLCLESVLAHTSRRRLRADRRRQRLSRRHARLPRRARRARRQGPVPCSTSRTRASPGRQPGRWALGGGEHPRASQQRHDRPARLARRAFCDHLRDPGVGLVGPATNRIGNEAEVDADYRT